VEYFAILMVLVGLLMVTLLAAYFFLHRAQEIGRYRGTRKSEAPAGTSR